MSSKFHYKNPFTLESGTTLPGYTLDYTAAGTLNGSGTNVVWVFHALTANSDPSEWWPGLVGEGKFFDPANHFIICVNMPGSCYGSTGPADINPDTGKLWLHDFPFFTIRDMVRAYQPLRLALGINRIEFGVGGSMGGQQLLEWAIEEPGLFRHIIPIATNALHSPWAKAFNASQRLCIEADPTWPEHHLKAGMNGMKVARSVALLSYRNYQTYEKGQAETDHTLIDGFKSESYQRYQGEKLAARFNAFSYFFLSKSMDSHNVGRGRPGLKAALGLIRASTLVIGVSSDLLFPLAEQEYLASSIPSAEFTAIDSMFGHDGFLLEFEQISERILAFIGKENIGIKQTEHSA